MKDNKSLTEKLKALGSEDALKRVADDGTTLREELGISPEEFNRYLTFATHLKAKKNWQDASDIYYFLAFLDPKSLPALTAYGSIELAHGSPAIAIGIFQTLQVQFPENTSTYFKLVECCLKLNEPIAGLYYLELFKLTFNTDEQQQTYRHQIETLKQECEKLLIDHTSQKDLSHVA